jgi:hypothetical protein
MARNAFPFVGLRHAGTSVSGPRLARGLQPPTPRCRVNRRPPNLKEVEHEETVAP